MKCIKLTTRGECREHCVVSCELNSLGSWCSVVLNMSLLKRYAWFPKNCCILKWTVSKRSVRLAGTTSWNFHLSTTSKCRVIKKDMFATSQFTNSRIIQFEHEHYPIRGRPKTITFSTFLVVLGVFLLSTGRSTIIWNSPWIEYRARPDSNWLESLHKNLELICIYLWSPDVAIS